MFIYRRCGCSGKSDKSGFSPEQFISLEERLKLIAVQARLKLLLQLKDSPHCVIDLMTHTGFSQSLVSHHLADLMGVCLVEKNKDGKFVEYFLNDNGKELLKALEYIGKCCEVAKMKGGEENMMNHDKHGCHCEGCGNETEEEIGKDLTKEELLAKKTRLEESLSTVEKALSAK